MKILDVEKKIRKHIDEIRILQDERNKKMRRLTILREHISMKLSIIEEQLEECLTTKTSFQKFKFESLQACQMAAYGLSTLLNVADSIKKSWEKEIEAMKADFSDCVASLLALQ